MTGGASAVSSVAADSSAAWKSTGDCGLPARTTSPGRLKPARGAKMFLIGGAAACFLIWSRSFRSRLFTSLSAAVFGAGSVWGWAGQRPAARTKMSAATGCLIIRMVGRQNNPQLEYGPVASDFQEIDLLKKEEFRELLERLQKPL